MLQGFSYTYDANGNRTGLIDPLGATTFAYDALNRLTQATYPAGYGTWTWTYDPLGNRTQQVAPSGTTLYTYDGNNRLIQAGAVVYTYDANGNMISSSIGEQGVYDPFNRLIQVTGQNGTATYTYNGDGLKVKRVGPDGATLYYHDGFRAIWETDAVGNLTNELDRDIFGNLLGRREGSGARRYVHSDGLGSTTALTDEAGAVTASVLYDAWGAVRIYTNPTLLGKYLFTGAEAEGVMPLYHMGARFYAPTLGRWLSEDPVQNAYFNPLTLNFYAYAFNNPALLSDPDGTRVVEFENGVSSDPIREAVTASQEERTPPAGWEAYVDLAVAASRKHGVPAELILAIMARENVAFDPNAVNPTTPDWGLMQVNIHTAPDYGIPLGSESKRLFNPETNISVGTRHLASLLRQFGGNETLAISAYNLGAGAVRRGGPVNTGYINDVQAYERWFRSRRCGGRC